MSPQWPNFILTSDIPYSEWDIFVLYRLNIETLNQIFSLKFE